MTITDLPNSLARPSSTHHSASVAIAVQRPRRRDRGTAVGRDEPPRAAPRERYVACMRGRSASTHQLYGFAQRIAQACAAERISAELPPGGACASLLLVP